MENSQKIRKTYNSVINRAIVYYTIISNINELGLTKGHLHFLGYLAVAGTRFNKKEYMREFDKAETVVNTTIHALRKKGLLVGKPKQLAIHPLICRLNFFEPISLIINLETNETS